MFFGSVTVEENDSLDTWRKSGPTPPRVTDNEPHPPALEAREDISRHTYIENDDGLRQNEA